MKVKTGYLSFSNAFICKEDVISIPNPHEARQNFNFTLDSNCTIVPVMQYHTFVRTCKRFMNKSQESSNTANPLIDKHISLLKFLAENSANDIGIQNETVIDYNKFYNFLINLKVDKSRHVISVDKNTLERLFKLGGYMHASSIAIYDGEKRHHDYMVTTKGSSTDILSLQYKDWIINPYHVRIIGEPVKIKPDLPKPVVIEPTSVNSAEVFSEIDLDIIDAFGLQFNHNTPSTAVSTSSSSNPEITFLYSKKRERPTEPEEIQQNKKPRYTNGGFII